MAAEERGRVVSPTSRMQQVVGYAVVDRRGNMVGTVHKAWIDSFTGALKFVGVKTGLGRSWEQSHIVPVALGTINDTTRSIWVSYSGQCIQTAPARNTSNPLTSEQERRVFAHYANW